MSALGQKRSSAAGQPNVRFAPKADIRARIDFKVHAIVNLIEAHEEAA
jgi:hypothetical protein